MSKMQKNIIYKNKTQMVDASNHLLKIIYFILKEYDQGFKYLDKAFEKKVHTLNALKVDPFLNDIRSHPKYTELLKKMDLDK